MDQVQRVFDSIRWQFANFDPAAQSELAGRIRDAVRDGKEILTYSEIVDGVTFRLPNVNDGRPYEIDVKNWADQDRAIIGDFLGKIDADSYRAGKIMASASVVAAETKRPSLPFFDLARKVGLLRGRSTSAEDDFWMPHLRLVQQWFRTNEL